jgi:hypothetical protein
MTPYYYDSPFKKKAYTPHVLHSPICNNFCLFLYLLSMYRLIIYPFIILQVYFSIAFNTYLVQQFNASFTSICVFLLNFWIRGLIPFPTKGGGM